MEILLNYKTAMQYKIETDEIVTYESVAGPYGNRFTVITDEPNPKAKPREVTRELLQIRNATSHQLRDMAYRMLTHANRIDEQAAQSDDD